MALIKHFHESVPGWAAFIEFYAIMVQRAPQEAQFVEVGSWLGKSACFMAVEILNSGKAINFVCVDPWEDGGPDLRDTPYYQKLAHPVYDTFLDNIKPVRHVITPLRMNSVRGAQQFADGEIDFLMLDGDHSYTAVCEDLAAWMPKMKKGSVIAGDDYLWEGVQQAVDEAFGAKVNAVIKKRHKNYRESVAYWWVQL